MKLQALDAIQGALEKQTKINELDVQASELVDSSSRFKNTSSEIHKKFCMRNCKFWACIIIVSIILLIIILMIICDPNFKKCK